MSKKNALVIAGLFVTMLTIFSCSKNKQAGNNNEIIRGVNAELIAVDPGMCGNSCCGGFEITIDNVIYPNGAHFYYVYKISKNFNVGGNPQFPIAVKVDYTIDKTDCGENYVDISSIKKR